MRSSTTLLGVLTTTLTLSLSAPALASDVPGPAIDEGDAAQPDLGEGSPQRAPSIDNSDGPNVDPDYGLGDDGGKTGPHQPDLGDGNEPQRRQRWDLGDGSDPFGGSEAQAPQPGFDTGEEGDGQRRHRADLGDGSDPFGGNEAQAPQPGFGTGEAGGGDLPDTGNGEGDERIDADLDNDGRVSTSDIIELMMNWGECDLGTECTGDLNHDGSVDVNDLVLLFLMWSN